MSIQAKQRIRAKIHGTAERPRLSVTVSNKHVVAQLVDDDEQVTLAFATSVGSKAKGSLSALATSVGEDIAKKGLKANIKKVVFDRNGRIYHGRVKAFAEAARSNGLEF